jgi:hypothetical protein
MNSADETKYTSHDKVLDALSHGTLSELKEDEILEALREEGVKNLEELVRRLSKSIRDLENKYIQRSIPLDLELLSKPTPSEIVSKIVHKVPKLPFIIGNTEYDPTDINRFNGQELHFVLATHPRGDDVLIVFREKMNPLMNYLQMKYISQLGSVWALGYAWPTDWPPGPAWPPPPTPPVPLPGSGGCGYPGLPPCGPGAPTPPVPPAPWYPTQVQFFEGINYSSSWGWLDAGRGWPDLTQVSRDNFLFFSSDWNDCISSLSSTGSECTYYEHINFQGSSIAIPPNKPVPNLLDIGWNDRISSIANWGTAVTRIADQIAG